MRFIDLHVHSNLSDGFDSPEKMLGHAKNLKTILGLCDGIRGEGYPSGIEVLPVSRRDLKQKLRKKLDYAVVAGGNYKVNRLAVAEPEVDILAHPDLGRRDAGVDAVVARAAGENKVAIEINLGRIINSSGVGRVHLLRNMKKILMLSRKYGTPLVASTEAKSWLELRGGDGIYQLLKTIGFQKEEAVEAMVDVPEQIIRGELKPR
jgi:ribonuclease P/MRP protein subunit RPP1